MPVSVLAPLLYLFAGFLLGKSGLNVKARASALLTRLIIPLVIIFNIATHPPGVFVVIAGIMAVMSLMLLISRLVTKDPVQNLCFCYLNIGWLGLPVASSLFGNGAAMIFIAAYVGSSLFGNSVGVGLLVKGADLRARIRETLKAPPVWSLATGILLSPFSDVIASQGHAAYAVLKFLMSFTGMAILGIWLSETPVRISDFRQALLPFIGKALGLFVLLSGFILVCTHWQIDLVSQNRAALYMICLLPPAANIVVLETHYLQTGRSASMIACGTVLSIIAVGIYALCVLL
jgi:hypothetical protein